MKQDNDSWLPKPSQSESFNKPSNPVMVSAFPLGIASCVLSSLLFGTHVVLLVRLHQMNIQEKFSFLINHLNTIGMLSGAELIGIPVALFLGGLSWRSKTGKAGLLLAGSFFCIALGFYLFGNPFSFEMGSGVDHGK